MIWQYRLGMKLCREYTAGHLVPRDVCNAVYTCTQNIFLNCMNVFSVTIHVYVRGVIAHYVREMTVGKISG